jgi:hypothetical protein
MYITTPAATAAPMNGPINNKLFNSIYCYLAQGSYCSSSDANEYIKPALDLFSLSGAVSLRSDSRLGIV